MSQPFDDKDSLALNYLLQQLPGFGEGQPALHCGDRRMAAMLTDHDLVWPDQAQNIAGLLIQQVEVQIII
jgi:hypothetical protein